MYSVRRGYSNSSLQGLIVLVAVWPNMVLSRQSNRWPLTIVPVQRLLQMDTLVRLLPAVALYMR